MKTSVMMVALAGLACGSAMAQTTTVNFSYSGTAFGSYFSTGSGSFSYPTGMSAIGISHLTSFTFSTSRDNPGIGFTSTYTYGLSDLEAFAANFDGLGNINELALFTSQRPASAANAPTAALGFAIPSWSTGTNTGTGQLQSDFGLGVSVDTTGPVTVTSIVPAPGAAALLGIGGLVATRRRRA